MKLRPLTEGAPGKSVWPAIDPYPAVHGLVLDFIGSKTCGRPFYKRVNDRYADVALIPGWGYSGSASNGMPRYAETRAGKLVPFANGVPRITDRGLLIEEARTNKVTINNANPISTAGITGAAVTLAADQGSAIAAEGLSELVSGGVVFKIDNSASGVGTTAIISGAVGNTQLHTLSAWIWGGSGSLRIASSVVAATFAASASPRRVSGSAVPLDSLAAFRIQVNAGQVVYFILPQLEEGAFVTSPIVTTGGAATRAADNASIAGLSAILAAPFTLLASVEGGAADGASRDLLSVSEGGLNTNSVRLSRGSANTAPMSIVAGGLAQPGPSVPGPFTGALKMKMAGRIRSTAARDGVNGTLSGATVITAPTNLNQLNIGTNRGTQGYWNGYIQALLIQGDLDDVALQALTA